MQKNILSFAIQGFRQYESLWHKRHYDGIRFSETVEVFPRRSYGAKEQQTIDLFRPRSATVLPLVVMVPGAYFLSLDSISLQAEIKAYTHAGYAVALVSYRTAPEYLYPTQIRDISLALRWLLRQRTAYNLESAFFLHGFQSGANLVLNYCNSIEKSYLLEAFQLDASFNHEHMRACILSNGIYDLEKQPFSATGWRSKLSQIFLGSQDSHALHAIASPAQHLAHTLPPLLLTATKNGTLTSQYFDLKHQLEQRGKALNMQSLLTDNPLAYVNFFDQIRFANKRCSITSIKSNLGLTV